MKTYIEIGTAKEHKMKNLQRVNNLTGQKFGRLTVIGLDEKQQTRKTYWICQCECGNIKTVRSDSLQNGTIRSCGCLKREQDRTNLTANHSHKQSGTRLYKTWQGIKKRCYDKHCACYYRYGGRGIVMCDEWKESFVPFYEWAIENGYSDELTIDRIDVNGNYEPDNCKWGTAKEQCNNRRTNIIITIGNATKTLTEWCEIFELDFKTILARYNRNGFISIDELFNK